MKTNAGIRDAMSNKVPKTKSLIRTLPSQFIANVNKNFKAEGAQWLRALPDMCGTKDSLIIYYPASRRRSEADRQTRQIVRKIIYFRAESTWKGQ
jgi:hypothetical protein